MSKNASFRSARELKTSSCASRSEEHTSELQSRPHLVCRLLSEQKKQATAHVGTAARRHRAPLPVVVPPPGSAPPVSAAAGTPPPTQLRLRRLTHRFQQHTTGGG